MRNFKKMFPQFGLNKTMIFRVVPQKKSNGVKSYDLGGQLISPNLKSMRPENFSVMLSGSGQRFVGTTSASRADQHKIGNHTALTLCINRKGLSFVVFKKYGPMTPPEHNAQQANTCC